MSKDHSIYISIILPAFNEEKNIDEFIRKTTKVIKLFADERYEMIFIDDGSHDKTFEKISKICDGDSKIKLLSFSRNFGKEAAILAGLRFSKGEIAVVMDCDMQHPPELIVDMEVLWREHGIKVVHAVKNQRQHETFTRRVIVLWFYKLMKFFSGFDLNNQSDFKMLQRDVIESYINLPEKLRFFRGLLPWLGYKSASLYFSPDLRVEGNTGWTLGKLIRTGTAAVCSFSSIPLQVVTILGMVTLASSFVLGIHTLFIKISGQAVEGFTTVIILLLLIGSIIMISLGVIGKYISMIYHEIKNRQSYIIEDTRNI